VVVANGASETLCAAEARGRHRLLFEAAWIECTNGAQPGSAITPNPVRLSVQDRFIDTAREPKQPQPDISLAQQLLGWQPPIVLKEGLAQPLRISTIRSPTKRSELSVPKKRWSSLGDSTVQKLKTRRPASFGPFESAGLPCPGPLVIQERWILRQHRQHPLPL
jgi:hypothetical protein